MSDKDLGRGGGRSGGNQLPARPVPGPVPPLREKPALRRTTPMRPVHDGPTALDALPPMPRRRRSGSRGALISFLLLVALPLAAVAVYYYGFASDQYVAEFRFSVTEMHPVLPGTSPVTASQSGTGTSGGGLGSMLGSYAVGNAAMQNFVVTDYLTSRQCVEELWKMLPLKEIYSKSSIDWWSRFDAKAPKEKFVEYWKSVLFTTYDPLTGIAIARVSAFSADEALRVAEAMVTLSEELVNRIAMRAQKDAVKFAETELARAEERMKDVRAELMKFRLKEGVIDPTNAAVSPNIALAQQLRLNLLSLETELSALGKQSINPNAPAVKILRSKIDATKQELARVEKEVSQDRGGSGSLADVMARFEKLDLERQYASNMLVSSQQAYDTAKANAAAQHLYLTPFVRPALPESSTQPRRAIAVMTAGLALVALWLALLTVARAIKDHVA